MLSLLKKLLWIIPIGVFLSGTFSLNARAEEDDAGGEEEMAAPQVPAAGNAEEVVVPAEEESEGDSGEASSDGEDF